MVPPVIQAVNDEITRLRGTAERDVQLPTVLVHQPKRSVLLLTAHIVIGGLVVTPGFASAGILADVYRGLAIHAQAFDVSAVDRLSVLFVDIGKDVVRLRNFFWGLALITGRSR